VIHKFNNNDNYDEDEYLFLFFIFLFKSTIYYTGHDGSLCLQKELCMEYQYSNLFYAVTQYKGLLRN